jgi:K+-sensing histidine kinase KdpD
MSNFENAPSDRPGRSRPFTLRYGIAVVTVALATWVRLLLDPLVGNRIPYATLLFAVLVTAWYGGVWPALLAVFLGVFSVDYFPVLPATD